MNCILSIKRLSFKRLCVVSAVFALMIFAWKEIDHAKSTFKTQENCYICGSKNQNLMSYYRKFSSIGVLHLGTMSIYDTGIRTFTENGLETSAWSPASTSRCSFSEGYGYIIIDSIPSHGFARLEIIYEEKDQLNLPFLKENLCERCLEKIQNSLDAAENTLCRNVFLVNFPALDLYALSGNLTSFVQNDYYFYIDHDEKKDTVFIIYVPRWREFVNTR